jgi:hypothetical protein
MIFRCSGYFSLQKRKSIAVIFCLESIHKYSINLADKVAAIRIALPHSMALAAL